MLYDLIWVGNCASSPTDLYRIKDDQATLRAPTPNSTALLADHLLYRSLKTVYTLYMLRMTCNCNGENLGSGGLAVRRCFLWNGGGISMPSRRTLTH